MDERTYDATYELADMVAAELKRLFAEGRLAGLEAKLKAAGRSLPDGCSLSLNFSVEVFDPDKDKALKTSDAGFAFDRDYNAEVHTYAPTPAKYVVDGAISKVPHDHCPHCWSRWNFKSRFHECPTCGYQMGREIKLLLDSDICPHCENAKISYANPSCGACGFTVDRNLVAWG